MNGLNAKLRGSRVEDRNGLALLATLLVMALVAVLTTVALSGAMSSVRASASDYQDMRAFYAAEAGGEGTLAQLKLALADGYLSDDEISNIKPPVLEAISFDSFSVKKMGETTVETITDGSFTGLYALTQNVDIYSRAATSSGDAAAVILRTKAQAIPIFQFGVFFEQDLEATNGPPLEFVGRVHANGNIYLSSTNAWYRDLVTTPNKIFHDRKDFHEVDNGVYINDASGNEVLLDFDSRTHAGAEAFKAESCAKFDCRVMTDAFDVDSLRLPLPDGVPSYELILPRQADDGDAERSVKFAWNADLYLTADLTNLVSRDAACGTETAPTKTSGDVTIAPLGPVYPGMTTHFVASHEALACSDFDARAELTVKSQMIPTTTTSMTDCNFSVDLPSDELGNLTIAIRLPKSQYPQLDSKTNGRARWNIRQIVTDKTNWPSMSVVRPAGKEAPGPADMCEIFYWEWSDFYDAREDELKDVLNVNMDRLEAWSNGNATRTTEILFVEIVVPPDISGYPKLARRLIHDATIEPAVRVHSGSILPNRLTLATDWPLYVHGDYNSVNKQPAALAGDAITVLSNAWEDEENVALRASDGKVLVKCPDQVDVGYPCADYLSWKPTWTKQIAFETTVNAAYLAGHWPTPCDHEEASCIADGTMSYYLDWYGGGLENFPRFLERWYDSLGSVTLHYKGALVSPFTSQKTTGTWNGSYYSAPRRDWHFDTDFQDPRLLPPGTPNVGFVLRTAMREAY